MIGSKEDFLERKPLRNGDIRWTAGEQEGLIQLIIERNRLSDKVIRLLFQPDRPKQTRLDLDRVGSLVWELADGSITVAQMGKQIREKIGPEVEPLYERLSYFVALLAKNGLIRFH